MNEQMNIGNSRMWTELCVLESPHIKRKKPKRNCDIKAAKKLLFS